MAFNIPISSHSHLFNSHSLPSHSQLFDSFLSVLFPFPPVPSPIPCFISIPMGFHRIPMPFGNPIPMHISTTKLLRAADKLSKCSARMVRIVQWWYGESVVRMVRNSFVELEGRSVVTRGNFWRFWELWYRATAWHFQYANSSYRREPCWHLQETQRRLVYCICTLRHRLKLSLKCRPCKLPDCIFNNQWWALTDF